MTDADVNYKLTGGNGSFIVTTPDRRERENYGADNQLSTVTFAGGEPRVNTDVTARGIPS